MMHYANGNKIIKDTFYKGIPVYRTNNDRSGSFCAIFLSRGRYDKNGVWSEENDINTVKHEYGYTIQQMLMGPISYGLMIGLPSWLEWSDRPYYQRPWEVTADVFGGVPSEGDHVRSQKDIVRGFAYLGVSALFGPLGYFFLFGEY